MQEKLAERGPKLGMGDPHWPQIWCLTTFCNRAQRCSALGRAAREKRSGITSRGRKESLPTLAISYSFLFTFVTEKQREIIQGNAHSIDLGRPPAW